MQYGDNLDLFTDATIKEPVNENIESLDINLAVDLPLSEKIEISKNAIKKLLTEGQTLFCMTSFGKDSSVMTAIVLDAIRELKQDNVKMFTTYILNSNTGLENPLIDIYAKGEIQDLRNYIAKYDLPVSFHVATPNLSNSFLANIIGGRNVASMPGMDRKCQQQLKKAPLDKLKAKLKKMAAAERGLKKLSPKHFTDAIGTRFDESAHRSNEMTKRGESAVTPTKVQLGGTVSYLISPLADFTSFDVFEFIGNVTNGKVETYSSFEALTQVYRDSEKGECMVNLFLQDKLKQKTQCNSRTGCYTCSAVMNDKSLENMLEDDEGRFEWMRPLNEFRNFITDSHWDMSKRSWLSRSVDTKTGEIKLSPNTYSALHCLDLLRYAMSIDADEQKLHPYAPRFTILPIEHIFYINALWARYGYFDGFKALETYDEIYNKGARYYPPKIENPVKRAPIPNAISISYCDDRFNDIFEGFRDVTSAVSDIEPTVEKGGKVYFSPHVENELSVDTEGAMLFLDFELDYILDKHKSWRSEATSSIFTLLRYGVMSINKSGHSEWDRMIRIANQHHRHGIKPEDLSDPVILKKKISESLGATKDPNSIDIFQVNMDITDHAPNQKDKRLSKNYREEQLALVI